MHRSVAKLALLLAMVVFSIGAHARQLQPAIAAGASCLPHERDALLTFKQAGNDTYDFLASWQRRHKDCCRWRGVTCSNETGHVIELDIGVTFLEGKISPSLLSLEHLEYPKSQQHQPTWTRRYFFVPRNLVFFKQLEAPRSLRDTILW